MKCGSLFRVFMQSVVVVTFLGLISPGLFASSTTHHGVAFPLGDLSFADRVVEYVPGSCVRAAYANPEMALGSPDGQCGGCYSCEGCDTNAVSLGMRLSELDDRGYIILEFVDNILMDGPGDDLVLFLTNDKAARVEISRDGSTFLFVGEVRGCPAGIDIGPYVVATDEFRFVRISDVPADEDRSACPGPSIDAVGAMGRARVIATEPRPDPTTDEVFVGEAFGSLSVMPIGELAFRYDTFDRNFFVLLDRSSSMYERIDGGEAKIDIAKQVLIELIDGLPEGGIFAVRTFGGECETELVAPATVASKRALREAVLSIQPSGLTPIARALEETWLDVQSVAGRHLVLLISDGIETCAGNPVRAAQELVGLGYDLMIHVVGFDVARFRGATEQLVQIAESSGGIYFGAESTEEFRRALGLDGSRIAYRVLDEGGQEVSRGILGDSGLQLPEGTYTIIIETPSGEISLPNVVVSAEQETVVHLDRTDGQYEADVDS